MCLILLAWKAARNHALVVAANRDEYHDRPAEAAGFWHDAPSILAGRDLRAGGTWMGVSRSGRFAAVTNFRGAHDPGARESRGALVARYLAADMPPAAYADAVCSEGSGYSGFNLLVADERELWWLSNRDGAPRRLDPGTYALGNLLLDSPEVAEARAQFARALEPAPALEALFGVLEAHRITAPDYGTRCATVLLCGTDRRVRFAERAFDPTGAPGETTGFEFPRAA